MTPTDEQLEKIAKELFDTHGHCETVEGECVRKCKEHWFDENKLIEATVSALKQVRDPLVAEIEEISRHRDALLKRCSERGRKAKKKWQIKNLEVNEEFRRSPGTIREMEQALNKGTLKPSEEGKMG